jgi:hypothetical protein
MSVRTRSGPGWSPLLPAGWVQAYRELSKSGPPAERITASGFGMELQLVDS